jgi:hypothetical protein
MFPKVMNNVPDIFNCAIILIVSVITNVHGASAGFNLVTSATHARSCAHTPLSLNMYLFMPT